MTEARRLPPTDRIFAASADVPPEKITSVEGVVVEGHLVVKKLLVGNEILMLEVFRGKGLVDPVHKHMDHESMGYLISGKLRLVIGGKEMVAGPGTAWVHPVGVEHFSEALEECHQLEIKCPPMKTWK
jgi:quercetin dioxygenase-like cupin family protein